MTLRAAAFIVLCGLVFGSLGCPKRKPAQTTVPAVPGATLSAATTTPTPAPADLSADFSPTVFAQISPLCQNARIPVIMYHDIIKKPGRGSVWFDCTVDEFKGQMDYLESIGATPISLETLHKHLTRGEIVPEKAVVLTFDDNYQGFYDNAWPILKAKNFPAAQFVHTSFVGDKKGPHPKMSWDTLRALDKTGLVTIASHTQTHPEDMTKLPLDKQDTEVTESKTILERELGHAIPYFAYPVGKGNQDTVDAVRRAGYTMAFMIDNGPAEESPDVLRIHRYLHTKIRDAFKDCENATTNAPASIVQTNVTASPVTLEVQTFADVKLGLVRGGMPSTMRALGQRQSVGEFISQAQTIAQPGQTVVAGMNGTFFADAALRGNSNMMIGPCQAKSEGVFYPEDNAYRLQKLRNRPLVIFSPKQVTILPFSPEAMNDEASLKTVVPDLTDVFLAGAWIVHDGQARTRSQMSAYSARDFNDPRRRAFFGIMDNGDIVLGATLDVVTTQKMAEAAQAAGVREAVLMDSGFSTSIVFDNKIIVTGHTAKNLPSRPVPHAIVLTGAISQPTDTDTVAVLDKAEPAVGTISAAEAQENLSQSADDKGSRRRRRRRN